MFKKTFKRIQTIDIMARSNFNSWLYSPRTWIMLSFVITFCYVVTSNFIGSIQVYSYCFHFTESLFYLLYNGCSITTTSILFLITISELPKRVSYQYNMLIRSSRIEWLESQMLYCLWMTLCMMALTVLSTSLFLAFHSLPGNGWTETAQIASEVIQENEALIPTFIRSAFMPWTACLYAMIPMFLFWLTMTFVVLLFSICRIPFVGLMTYAFMLVANVIFMVDPFYDFPMPIYYATLNDIISGLAGQEFLKVEEASIGYGIAIVILMASMCIGVKKTDLVFHSEQ